MTLLQQANTVYRLGNYEYSLQWRDAPESAQYAALKYGAWMLELKGHLQDKIDGKMEVCTHRFHTTQIH